MPGTKRRPMIAMDMSEMKTAKRTRGRSAGSLASTSGIRAEVGKANAMIAGMSMTVIIRPGPHDELV